MHRDAGEQVRELLYPSGVLASNPWRHVIRSPTRPDRPGASGPRCGVSPGSTSFPWSPGPESGRGFFHFGGQSVLAPFPFPSVGGEERPGMCVRPGKGLGGAGKGRTRAWGVGEAFEGRPGKGPSGQRPGRWHKKGHRPPPVAHTGHKENLYSSTFLKDRCVPGQAVYKTAPLAHDISRSDSWRSRQDCRPDRGNRSRSWFRARRFSALVLQ